MASPSVAVIIPVWNGREYLVRSLDALHAQAYAPLEIIAVDNASTDGSAALIAERYPDVTLLRQAENLGFAGACNVGLRHAATDVRVILNQDTEVEPGWLAALTDALTAEPRIGLAGSKALYPDGTIQHAGALLDPQNGGQHLGLGEPDDGRVDAPAAFDFLSGVALAISSPAYAAVGGLDEGFAGAYFEDVDWCYRVCAAGFELAFVPTSRLIHYEESRAASDTPESVYSFQRNRLRLLLKHWPLQRLRNEFLPAEQAWLSAPHSADFLGALRRAYADQMLHLGELMAWRDTTLGADAGTHADLLALLLALSVEALSVTAKQQAATVAEVDARMAAQPVLPQSAVPLVGPLIDWLRRQWSHIGADPQVYARLAQQDEINRALLATVHQLQEEQQRMAVEFVTLTTESARELHRLPRPHETRVATPEQ
jgi:GT2 family glycosyltransferase